MIFYQGREFSYPHEEKAKNRLKAKLRPLFEKLRIRAHVAFSFRIEGADYDCVIFTKQFFVIIDFKEVVYKLSGLENGNWWIIYPNGKRHELVRNKNPFEQVLICRSKLSNRLIESNMINVGLGLKSRGQKKGVLSEVIRAGVVVHPKLDIDTNVVRLIEKNKFFFVEAEDSLAKVINELAASTAGRGDIMSDSDIKTFIKMVLGCSEDYGVIFEEVSPKRTAVGKVEDSQLRECVESDIKRDLGILATAGSGKTEFIARRTAYLISKGISPGKIALITFTNEASVEITGRLAGSGKIEDENILYSCGTIHNFCFKVVKDRYRSLGYEKEPLVIDEERDAKIFKNYIIPDLNLDVKVSDLKDIFQVMTNQCRVKKEDIKYYLDAYWPGTVSVDDYLAVVDRYLSYLKRKNWVSFQAMLVFCRDLLGRKEVRDNVAGGLSVLLVDEFQDITRLQFEMFKMLNSVGVRLNFAGDRYQAIYAFLGATTESIPWAKDQLDDVVLRTLTSNRRSDRKIVDLANRYVQSNYTKDRFRPDRPPSAVSTKDGDVYYKTFSNEREEAGYIAAEIKGLRKRDVPYRKIGVLLRADKQGNVTKTLVNELKKSGIPYAYKEPRFKELPHIKKTMYFLNAVFSGSIDAECLMDLCAINGKCGRETAAWVLKCCPPGSGPDALIEKIKGRPGEHSEASFLVRLLEKLKILREGKISLAIMSFYKEDYPEFAPMIPGDRADSDIDRLLVISESSRDFKQFKQKMILQYADEKAGDGDAIRISSIHGAKGKTWDYVFVIGLVDGIIPHMLSKKYEVEEEKNTLYVAITRPRHGLYLCYSKRMNFGERKLCPYLEFVKAKFNQ